VLVRVRRTALGPAALKSRRILSNKVAEHYEGHQEANWSPRRGWLALLRWCIAARHADMSGQASSYSEAHCLPKNDCQGLPGTLRAGLGIPEALRVRS